MNQPLNLGLNGKLLIWTYPRLLQIFVELMLNRISFFRLRALSQGTSMSSPPPSPGLPKFKLAEHRYGREEMLAYFPKDIKMPPDLKQFAGLHKEQCQPPVTLLAMTEDEQVHESHTLLHELYIILVYLIYSGIKMYDFIQRIWSRSVNSDAVLRLMGKGPSGPSGVTAPRGGRGGSIDRGRGRG